MIKLATQTKAEQEAVAKVIDLNDRVKEKDNFIKYNEPVDNDYDDNDDDNSNAIARALSTTYTLFLFVLVLNLQAESSLIAHFHQTNDYKLIKRPIINLRGPNVLSNYDSFRSEYNQPSRNMTMMTQTSERDFFAQESRRRMLFIGDSLRVCQHNLATLLGRETYFVEQSPFRSDLTSAEQLDLINRSNLIQISTHISYPSTIIDGYNDVLQKKNNVELDGHVSGLFKRDQHSSAELKSGNLVDRWFTRLINDDTFFEIPNYPLDAQPNPDKITHIDADLRSCTDAIKDQKNCGACYAFSWLSLVEWHYCKQMGLEKPADFSEQHIVDCGYKAHLNGCVEGRLPDVKDFTQVFGLQLESDYPYTSKKGQCKPSGAGAGIQVKVTEFKRVKVDREQFERLLEEQPILLEVHLPADIAGYSRGIHPGHNCDKDTGHGMLLVGHGRQDGQPYWLLRNSMGRKWGENGYLRLSRDMPDMQKCFNTGFVAKFKFKNMDEDKYTELYDSFKFEPQIETPEMRLRRHQ